MNRGALRYAAAWILGGALLAVVAVVVLGGRSEDVSLPPVRQPELRTAARAAGCELVRARAGARLNPPVDGPGSAPPAAPGVYERAPAVDALTAALRRGVVVIHVRPDVLDGLLEQLTLLQRAVPEGTLVTPNATRMRYAVAATAYRRLLGCPRITPATLDAVRLFRGRFIGSGPE